MLELNEVRHGRNSSKLWPKDLPWAEPLFGGCGIEWDGDLVPLDGLDDEAEDLMDIKDYYDSLMDDGILDSNYTLIDKAKEGDFVLEIGEEYWIDDGFDIRAWEDDLTEHMNLIKVDTTSGDVDAAMDVQEIIGYTFINENLLRQAFTRRAFQIEYELCGCSEELEFIGDAVLGTCVTKDIIEQLAEVDITNTDAPFGSKYTEGDFSKLRQHYVSKEYLSQRASELGLDKYILYGSQEEPTESSREDMMESLIGAVAIDSGWDMEQVCSVIDHLITVQLEVNGSKTSSLLKKSFYEVINSWHQKNFGRIPEYEITGRGPYHCEMRYTIPENDEGINTTQHIYIEGETRGKARELAAEFAYRFVTMHGLWKNIKDSGITPDFENSINQLQELYQKHYLDNRPDYTLTQMESPEILEEDYTPGDDIWECILTVDDIVATAHGTSKIRAKKAAAFEALKKLL